MRANLTVVYPLTYEFFKDFSISFFEFFYLRVDFYFGNRNEMNSIFLSSYFFELINSLFFVCIFLALPTNQLLKFAKALFAPTYRFNPLSFEFPQALLLNLTMRNLFILMVLPSTLYSIYNFANILLLIAGLISVQSVNHFVELVQLVILIAVPLVIIVTKLTSPETVVIFSSRVRGWGTKMGSFLRPVKIK